MSKFCNFKNCKYSSLGECMCDDIFINENGMCVRALDTAKGDKN